MILIYPPAAKPCAPPAGLARLSGTLNAHGISHLVLDANLETLMPLAYGVGHAAGTPLDRWTARAFRNASRNCDALKQQKTYSNIDRYKRTVADLNRAISKSAGNSGAAPGLANYRQDGLSPLRSKDLIRAAEEPEINYYYRYYSIRLGKLIEKQGASAVGFSLNYLSQALCAFSMIGFIRKEYPGMKIIIGGGLVTSWMQSPEWKDPFSGLVDRLVSGPGERQLLSFCGIETPEECHCMPDYSAFLLDEYLAPGRVLPYSASSGCYWRNCSFCPEKAEGNPYVPLPLDRVMDHLHHLVREIKPALVHLLDNSVSPGLLMRIAADPPGVPWYGFARISGLLTDPHFCAKLAESGCVMLKLGLESGDQGVLDAMNKGIDLQTASRVLKTLRGAGIAAYVYMLFGTPPETPGKALNSLDFIARHRDSIGFLNIAIFNMPLYCKETAGIEKAPFYEGDLSLYTDFKHPEGWSRSEVRKFLNSTFRKHPAVAGIIQRDPPVFTSNHAPFFL